MLDEEDHQLNNLPLCRPGRRNSALKAIKEQIGRSPNEKSKERIEAFESLTQNFGPDTAEPVATVPTIGYRNTGTYLIKRDTDLFPLLKGESPYSLCEWWGPFTDAHTVAVFVVDPYKEPEIAKIRDYVREIDDFQPQPKGCGTVIVYAAGDDPSRVGDHVSVALAAVESSSATVGIYPLTPGLNPHRLAARVQKNLDARWAKFARSVEMDEELAALTGTPLLEEGDIDMTPDTTGRPEILVGSMTKETISDPKLAWGGVMLKLAERANDTAKEIVASAPESLSERFVRRMWGDSEGNEALFYARLGIPLEGKQSVTEGFGELLSRRNPPPEGERKKRPGK